MSNILQINQSDHHAISNVLENRIDEMIFKLYSLTYEEVKVIAPDFWLGEVEYEKTKME